MGHLRYVTNYNWSAPADYVVCIWVIFTLMANKVHLLAVEHEHNVLVE